MKIYENKRTIILSSAYPSENEIANAEFIHKRILAYKEFGLNVDMFQIHPHLKNGKRVYDGVNVIHGNAEFLFNILKNNNIGTVCVHFLDPYLWSVLKLFKDKIRILVWLHGYEIQPYWRRMFNHDTPEKLKQAKKISEHTMNLWNEIFNQIDNYDIHFIFVSQYFADIVFEDYKIQLPKDKYYIIHNCIDTDIFEYKPKVKEQRLKIFTVSSYSTKTYANDLKVQTILELSKKDYFNKLDFFVGGKGVLFDKITLPLKKFKNVTIENRFYSSQELSKIYSKNGIVIIPTRTDTHGVSRDEAMSCGCVPITTAVACIPEFVDETCGILAEGENVQQMVDGIDFLYHNPDKFLELSENAAKRVRSQTSKEHTIAKEIELIKSVNYISSVKIGNINISGLKTDYVFNKIKNTNNFYEIQLLQKWNNYFSHKDYVVLDIGANIGNHTLYWHDKVKEIYSFEPFDLTFNILKNNLGNNNIKNVTLINKCVGETKSFAKVEKIYDDNLGATTFKSINNAKGYEETYEVIDIDTFILDNNLSKIDAIKIDTEGFEIGVLKGMKNVLQKLKPNIWIEITENTCNEALTILLELGYDIIDIEWFNVMLVHKSKNKTNISMNILNLYSFTCQVMRLYNSTVIEYRGLAENYKKLTH